MLLWRVFNFIHISKNNMKTFGAKRSPYDKRTKIHSPSVKGTPLTSGGIIYQPQDIENQHTVGICTAIDMTKPDPEDYVLYSQKGRCLMTKAVVCWFGKIYKDLRLQGCSSHSGRRTFGTKVAKNITLAGGSAKDIQRLLGHSCMNTTQRYIDVDVEAQRKVVQMI